MIDPAIAFDFCRVVPGSTDMSRDIAVTSLLNLAKEIVPALQGDPAHHG